MATLRVDLDKCIRAGECFANHPALFQQGKDGYPVVLVQHPDTPELKDEARESAFVCPGAAIVYEE